MTIYVAILCMGIVGHVIAAWSLVTSLLEFHGLVVLKMNGARRLTAVSNVLRDAFMMSAQAIVILVGVGGVIIDHNHPSATVIGPSAWLFESILMTSMLLIDRYRRWRQGRMYDQRVRQEHPHPLRRGEDEEDKTNGTTAGHHHTD